MNGKRVAALLSSMLVLLSGVFGTAQAVERGFAQRLLAAHNDERERMGVPQLVWSSRLADEAQPWADELARRGVLVHTTREARRSAGENLWMSAPGWYGPEDMIGAFVNEGRYFRPGRFPNVSTTSDWYVVGHYTQLIWPETREVGCAVGETRNHEVLVCRYWPSGNINGVQLP
jgi:hypothetical protein